MTEPYALAIRAAVRPGDVVIDLSAGIGMHAFEACRAGASRVYAAEDDRTRVRLIEALAAENGFADRVVPVRARALDIDVPARASILVASTLPACVGIGAFIEGVAAVRRRAVLPEATFIPAQLNIFCAPVDMASWHHRHIERWSEPRFGLSFQPGRRVAANTLWETDVEPGALLATPVPVAAIQLSTCEPARLLADVRFVVNRPGTLHAIAGWIAAALAEGVDVSQGPASQSDHVGRPCLFPIDPPLTVAPGNRIELSLRMDVGAHPLWTWRVRLFENDDERADRRHSTFLAALLDLEGADKERPDFTPTLSERGRAELERLRSRQRT